jgi:uncharacterized protein (DUF2249 family)
MNKKALAMNDDQPGQLHEAASNAGTLSAEHAGLLREVSVRADAVTAAVNEDHWPTRELHRLLDYLHVEVLRQVVDEEWLLFRHRHHAPDTLLRLQAEHLALRRAIEELTDGATGASQFTIGQLTAAITGLLRALDEHFRTEQALLHRDDGTPSTSSLGAAPHDWYAHTEGPVIDLAALPGSQGVDAVLGRLLRLGPGERITLQAPTDPGPLWRRLAVADPDGYGFRYLQHGPEQWRVEIVRRPAR